MSHVTAALLSGKGVLHCMVMHIPVGILWRIKHNYSKPCWKMTALQLLVAGLLLQQTVTNPPAGLGLGAKLLDWMPSF